MRISRLEIASFFIALSVALGPVVGYHAVSREYPTADDAQYMKVGLSIYRRFFSDGVLGGLKALYTVRTWKPILHPILAVPGLFLTEGRVIPTQKITTIIFFFFFAAAIYVLARIYLGKLDSILATGLLTTIPWLSERAWTFNSELPFIMFFYGTWAALFHSDALRKRDATLIAAVFAGLTLCVRPIEGGLFFGILLAGFAGFLQREKLLPWKEIRNCFIIATLMFAPMVLADTMVQWVSWNTADSIIAVAVASAWTLYFLRFRKSSKSNTQLFVLISLSIAVLWFADFIPSVENWVSQTSYHRGDFQKMERFGFLNMYLDLKNAFTGPATLSLIVLAAVFGRDAIGHRTTHGVPKLTWAMGVMALLLTVHFCLGARSYNTEIRYYLIETASLTFMLMIFFLRSPKFIWVKRGMTAALLSAQFVTYLQSDGLIAQTDFQLSSFFGNTGVPPALKWEDPGAALYGKLAPDFSDRKHHRVLVYLTKPEASLGISRIVEPDAMSLRAMEDSRDVEFVGWGALQFQNGKYIYINEEHPRPDDLILVGPVELAEPGILDRLKKYGSSSRIFKTKTDGGPERTPIEVSMLLIKP